ncbi:MAG: hypothetical protein KKA84_12785 [Bacteroidetes bacterium]|nr:hypothetical protein [Bacteroidota bacterium]
MCCYSGDPEDDPLLTSELSISGSVVDDYGTVNGAIVRIQCTDRFTQTDSSGKFIFEGLNTNILVKLTAWAEGYYIAGGAEYPSGVDTILLHLIKIPVGDNPDYEWLSSYQTEGKAGNCENCHSESGGSLPFDEWILDAHSKSASNSRFLSMYLGSDVYGNQSPPTRFGYNRDYGYYPLPPKFDDTWFGPGYKLDFPSTQGNCAACHAPLLAVNNPYGIDPSILDGVAKEGINCDFCHKIWDVKLNEVTGLPNDNMPGVLSYDFRRPEDGHQFFAGPFDDVAPGEDTYREIQNESAYCAPCHYAKFWDVEIYTSYGEWLASPYSNTSAGQTCQDCHMPPGMTNRFATVLAGGNVRESSKIYSHLMPGARDENLLRNSVTMSVNASRNDNEVSATVEITNNKTGHHVPTDSPLRHLILLVEAVNENGNRLEQKSGSVLPDWCGIGDPNEGYYAKLPGKVYAKILEDSWSGYIPTAAYWNRTRIISDTRLAAFETDRTSFTFSDEYSGNITLCVSLLYRRAYKQLMDWKNWNEPDIVMVKETIEMN